MSSRSLGIQDRVRIEVRVEMFFRNFKKFVVISLVFCWIASVSAQTPVQLQTPITVTSAGQSADAALVEVVLRRTGIEAELVEMLSADSLTAGDITSLVFVLGGSQKGLGAAGINPEEELERVAGIIDWAEANDVPMVGVHVGGEGRRGPLSERFNSAAAPRMNLLVVTSEGNQDGFFTTVATENGIELIEVTDTLEVGPTIQEYLADN